MQRIDILDPDCRNVIEDVSRHIARGMVREGRAAWIDGRPAIRLLRNHHLFRDQSANPGPAVIVANASGQPDAQAIVSAWRERRHGLCTGH